MNSQHDPYLKMNPIAGQVITNKNSINLDNLVSTWALAHTFNTTLFPTYLPGTCFRVLDKNTVSYDASKESLDQMMATLVYPDPKKIQYICCKYDYHQALQAGCIRAGIKPQKVKGTRLSCTLKTAFERIKNLSNRVKLGVTDNWAEWRKMSPKNSKKDAITPLQ